MHVQPAGFKITTAELRGYRRTLLRRHLHASKKKRQDLSRGPAFFVVRAAGALTLRCANELILIEKTDFMPHSGRYLEIPEIGFPGGTHIYPGSSAQINARSHIAAMKSDSPVY